MSCTLNIYRKSGTWLGQRELRLFKLLLSYITDPSAAENFIDLILPFFSKKDLNSGEPCLSKFFCTLCMHSKWLFFFFHFIFKFPATLTWSSMGLLYCRWVFGSTTCCEGNSSKSKVQGICKSSKCTEPITCDCWIGTAAMHLWYLWWAVVAWIFNVISGNCCSICDVNFDTLPVPISHYDLWHVCYYFTLSYLVSGIFNRLGSYEILTQFRHQNLVN